ncbi:hypothetical protein V5O48_017276, partial [Marasmius crinis-equi]
MQFKSFVVLALSTAALAAAGSTEEKRQVPLANVYETCVTPGTAAVTFDDGPYNYVNAILKTLKDNNAKATFFMNGNNWRCIYDMDVSVLNVLGEGHQIASHTWSHPDLNTLKKDEIETQMSKVDEAIVKITGKWPAFMRPPYGNYNDEVREVAAARGQSLVNWDFDSGDSVGFTAPQSEDAYAKLIEKKPSTIIALNHETKETTAKEVVANVIPQLAAAGYKMVTVSECLGMPAYINETAPQTKDPKTW